ncbi:MAG: DUF2062 domain-containing protein [Paraglaciecola sp.]|uniref:DUF2062 domain-containing protein n=1 Tax=Paraglaciecola sp. TaxID=1920173 RepID=UPI003297E00F
MLKKLIKRFLPSPQKIKENKVLSIFGTLLHDPNLWHLNRRSAAGAVAVGLFFAFIPLPFQMWLSAGIAIPLRVNLPLSIATVWITNPFTMPPIFYGAYLVGSTVLGTTTQEFAFELSWHWVVQSMETIGPAFLVGCFICAVFFSTVGYFVFNYLWRLSVSNAWHQRKHKKKRN